MDPGTSPEQVRKHPINMSLVVYQDIIPDREERAVIDIFAVKDVRASSVETIRDSEAVDFPLSVDFHEKRGETRNRGLWIGMWFPGAESFNQKSVGPGRKDAKASETALRRKRRDSREVGKKDSVSTALDKSFQTAPSSPKAMRVISVLGRINNVCYALAPPVESERYCTAYKVLLDEVFFFPEFRDDDLDSFAARKSKWSELVRSAKSQLVPTAPPSAGKKRTSAAAGVSKDVDEMLNRSVAARLGELYAMYETTGGVQYLIEATKLLEKLRAGSTIEKAPRDTMLVMLWHGQLSSLEEAQLAHEQLVEARPDLKEFTPINAENLLYVSQAIASPEVIINPHLVHRFTVALCDRIAEIAEEATEDLEQSKLVSLAKRVAFMVTKQAWPSTSKAEQDIKVTQDPLATFVKSDKEYLPVLRDYVQRYRVDLESELSPYDDSSSIPALLAELNRVWDVDAVEEIFNRLHCAIARALCSILRRIETFLDERVSDLAEMLASLHEAQQESVEDGEDGKDGEESDESDESV